MNWPADRIERRPIATLIASARNARTHSPAQVEQIAASLEEWGWTNPVLVNEDGTIIAGHGRVLAALLLGWTECPVMVAIGWSDLKQRAYALADNKLALNADWNLKTLEDELRELELEGFSVPLIGFNDAELSALFTQSTPPTDPEAEWRGMPEYDQANLQFRSIIMHFADAVAVAAFLQLIGQEVTDKTKFLWYPARVEQPKPREHHYVAPVDAGSAPP